MSVSFMSQQLRRSIVCGCILAALAFGSATHADEPVPASAGDKAVAAKNTADAEAKPTATPDQINGWIKDLDDARYLTREEATQNLLSSGAASLDPLLATANGDRPEPSDRAIWIMRRLGRSREDDLALAALDRLVQLKNRPAIVAKAESDHTDRTVALCERRLGRLGAEVNMEISRIDQMTVGPVLVVRLAEKWHGTSDDLRQVSQIRQQRNFRLEGAPIGDDQVKMFAEKEKLAYLQLINTKVTPDAVDLVKTKHPNATVHVRNQALLGVAAENHATGVMVIRVEPGTAAAGAGIVPGDVIVTIDGHKLPDFDRLTARIAQHQPGDKVDIEIIRNEKLTPLKVALGNWPTQE
jgi:PDZ domain